VLAQINAERGDFLDAEAGFFFAISLEPNEATPHHWYSILLARVGRLEAALAQAKRAQELDPTSPVIAANLANAYLYLGDEEQALRLAKEAADLGLGKKNIGVETQVAVRRGQWDEARRQIVQQEGIPEEVRPMATKFIDALADPALRPRLLAEMRAVDPTKIPQVELVGPYLQLGQTDLVYRILFESLDEDPRAWVEKWDLGVAWSEEGAAFRKDARFVQLAERMGLLDYWKQYGYPDHCRAGTDTPIVCS
jgi:tetratricopeptide (TPR) repeat protein